MEMTIEEIIKELEWALANNTIEDAESAFKYILAIHMAIDNMRKYQKIEDIYYHQSGEALENSLRVVIEDGKID